jgi:hypothetical protein
MKPDFFHDSEPKTDLEPHRKMSDDQVSIKSIPTCVSEKETTHPEADSKSTLRMNLPKITKLIRKN